MANFRIFNTSIAAILLTLGLTAAACSKKGESGEAGKDGGHGEAAKEDGHAEAAKEGDHGAEPPKEDAHAAPADAGAGAGAGAAPDKSAADWRTKLTAPKPMVFEKDKKYRAKVETSEGSFTIEFFPNEAPQHVTNFLYLAQLGFFDGLSFHRVIPGFVVQGGCPLGNGTGNPGYNVKAEFNAHKHVKGAIAMARAGHPDSAGSQWYIALGNLTNLDNNYTVFGQIVEGIEVTDKLAQFGSSSGTPSKKLGITKVTKLD